MAKIKVACCFLGHGVVYDVSVSMYVNARQPISQFGQF